MCSALAAFDNFFEETITELFQNLDEVVPSDESNWSMNCNFVVTKTVKCEMALHKKRLTAEDLPTVVKMSFDSPVLTWLNEKTNHFVAFGKGRLFESSGEYCLLLTKKNLENMTQDECFKEFKKIHNVFV